MTTPLRVLIVEDSEADAEILRRLLREGGYDITADRVDTDLAMRTALGTERWDAVIAGYPLQRLETATALEILQETGLDLPFLVVSGTAGEDLAAAMMRSGAHDYLMKDKLARLPIAVQRELRKARARRQAQETLQSLQRQESTLAEAQALAKIGNWQVRFQGDKEQWTGSREFRRIWGGGTSFPLTTETGIQLAHPEDKARVDELWSAAKRGEGRRHEWEFRVVVDGRVKWIQTRVEFKFDPTGTPIEAYGTSQDITERKVAEIREHHLTQVLQAIREINKLVIGAKDRQQLIWEACKILVAARGYDKAWIVLAPSGGRPMALASAGWGEAFAPFERKLKGGYKPPCFEWAATSPEALAVLQPGAECGECPLTLVAPETAGVAALRHGETEYGHIGIRVSEGFALDAEERAVLRELGTDLAFALHAIESEEHRRASEERFRVSFEKAAVGQALTSCEGGFLRVNDALAEMLGSSRVEIEAKSIGDVVHPHDLPSTVDAMFRLLSGGPPQYLEKRYLRQDGKVLWVDASIALLRDSAGRPEHFIMSCVDRTRAKLSEEALQVQEERLRLAVEGAALGTWHWEIASGQLVWSDRMCAMFGLAPGTPRTHADFLASVHEDDREAVESAARGALASSAYEAEFRIRWPDGSEHWIASVGRSYRDERGTSVRMEGVARDATEQKRLEAQLRQAQKMEAVGRLAGGVAHDFNNILGVIQGRCDLILNALREDDPLFRNASLIQASGERAAALTRQLLAFSRQQPLQPEILDLNVRVRGLEGMLRRLIGEDVEFATALGEDLGRVKADPSQIEQVIINLAVNARDAMPDGGKLLVETANVDLDLSYVREHVAVVPGPYVLLAVTDTGCGMDKSTKDRVFEPFFTTKEKGKGTGLGLATVYGIVKQSGGYVWVYSEAGRGSTFKVYLPRTDEPAASGSQPSDEGSLEGAGQEILVVEDDAAMRDVVRDVLDGLGYRTAVAANGGEALLAIEEAGQRPDLLITDCVMPGMSGELLADRLRRTHPALRVLFMSGYTDQGAFRNGVLREGSPFLQKPFRAVDLAAKVKGMLSRPSGRD